MKIFKYFLFLIIAMIIWYFLYDKDHSKPSVSLDNTINNEAKETITPKIAKPEKKKKVFDVVEITEEKTLTPEIDSQLTYLQAYRNTVFFNKCYGVIKDINKNISPLIKFKKDAAIDFYDILNKSTKQATDLQLQYFSDFSQHCQSFLYDDKETHESAKQRIYNIFNTLEPKTESEKLLEEGLDLYIQFKEIQKSINETTKSHSLLSDEELKIINTKIKTLSNQINELKANPDWQTNHQIQIIINDLSVKWSNLYLEKRNNRVTETDNEAKNKIEEQILLHKNVMVSFLKKSNSPDILLLYSRYIFHPTYQNNNPIINDMKRELNTYDIYLMLNLYDVGIKIAACAMNYPCDDQSEFILDYCIRGFNQMSNYPDACGKTLETFYFNKYLGPNQLEDVSNYLNYILDNYAKK